MPRKREIIEQLKRDELLAVVDQFELQPPDRRSRDGLIDTVASSRKASLDWILYALKRDRLKELCRVFSLDDSGKQKAEIAA